MCGSYAVNKKGNIMNNRISISCARPILVCGKYTQEIFCLQRVLYDALSGIKKCLFISLHFQFQKGLSTPQHP